MSCANWAVSQGTQTHIILGVSVRAFLDEIYPESADYVKQIALPYVGGPHSIS